MRFNFSRMIALNIILPLIALFFTATSAYAGGITANFYPVQGQTLAGAATIVSGYVQFTSAAALASPDVMINNYGSQTVYFDLGTGGADFATSVPSNFTGGGIAINPGEVIILNRRNYDTVAFITASSSSSISATPGTGQ